MVAVGEDGEVFTYVGGKHADEKIEPSPIVLRNVATIDGFATACGMKRQVYRRINEGSWIEMHAPPPAEGENAGFEAIDGYSADEIYAVGWSGEIWQWNGASWISHASPTNLILTGVCCADDGSVYACGQHGTLIRGRDGSWELVEFDSFAEDFWDVIWFEGALYLATMTMVYKFIDGGLGPAAFGSDPPASCYRLTSADGVLWSVGSSDVFSFDGSVWTRVD